MNGRGCISLTFEIELSSLSSERKNKFEFCQIERSLKSNLNIS